MNQHAGTPAAVITHPGRMRAKPSWVLAAVVGIIMLCAGCGSDAESNNTSSAARAPLQPQCSGRSPSQSTPLTHYDRTTLALRPVLYLTVSPGAAGTERNLVNCKPGGRYLPFAAIRAATRLPDGESAAVFSGSESLRIPSSPPLSITHTGSLTIEAWIKPATLTFATVEGTGYVEWLGKGFHDAFEYALRIYSQGNSEGRANRISGYAFNPRGRKGSGSYFQDAVRVGQWIMVTVEFDTASTPEYPTGWAAIYKNAVLRQRTGLDQFDVVPRPGPAPLSVGTLDDHSYFQGSIAKVAVFDRVLPPSDLAAQNRVMVR